MPPSDGLILLPLLTKQELAESRQEAENVELHDPQQHFPLHRLHLPHLLLLHLLAEAHEEEEGEHGELEARPHLDSAGRLRLSDELAEEVAEGPHPGAGVGLDAGRVEDFCSQVAAEEAPGRAVAGGGDADGTRGGGRGAIGEGGAGGDEGAVGCSVVGDEDEGAAADGEGDDRAVGGTEVMDDRANRREGLAEEEGVAEIGETRRAGWEAAAREGGDEEGDSGGEEET